MPAWLPDHRPAVMGILNVTPDSFSDGGRYLSPQSAITRGKEMVDEGADWIDIGGESTRPGAESVDVLEEIRRVMPVVSALARAGVRVSIDTSKAEVARVALNEGARLVNDVTALSDPEMLSICVEAQCGVCLMHMQGTPREMQHNPTYTDVVAEITDFLRCRANAAESQGMPSTNIWIDPGIGFGKSIEHNLRIIRETSAFVAVGYPVLIGLSRKSFLPKLLEDSTIEMESRDDAGIALQACSQLSGARIFRVHDPKKTRRAAEAVAALMNLH